MFTFSYFQFIPNCQKLWQLKNQFFLLLHTAVISLALPLSLLPFTRDTHIMCLQWNVSQCVQIWIFNVSNTDSVTQTIYLWYKYYLKWICVSFSFQYIIAAMKDYPGSNAKPFTSHKKSLKKYFEYAIAGFPIIFQQISIALFLNQ